MANTQSANVIRIDTDAAFANAQRIKAIRYQAGTSSPSVTIHEGASADNNIVYFADGTADIFEEVPIYSRSGVFVNVAGTGTVVFLYLE